MAHEMDRKLQTGEEEGLIDVAFITS